MAGTYVERRVADPTALQVWWGSQRGVNDPIQLDDNLHATISYSTTEFIPELRNDTIRVKPLYISTLGPKNAVVLHLEAPELAASFYRNLELGATSTYPSFMPHITLFYLGMYASESDIKRWNNGISNFIHLPDSIELGPELCSPLQEEIDYGLKSFIEWLG